MIFLKHKMKEIENLELLFLSIEDYPELKEVMQMAYSSMESSYWKKHHIEKLISLFPEGQVVLKINGEIAACALSLIVQSGRFEKNHTYKQITGNYSFDTHDPLGDVLYGIDVFVKPEFRGMRLGRRLYDYRKELCEKLNLKGTRAGGAELSTKHCNFIVNKGGATTADFLKLAATVEQAAKEKLGIEIEREIKILAD